MDQELAEAAVLPSLHSSDGSTFLHEMTKWPPSWKYNVISETPLRQPIHIYKNVPAKLNADQIWNSGALRLFWKRSPQKEEQQNE